MTATAALVTESHALAYELFALLEALDPARWRDELAPALRARLSELRARLDDLLRRAEAALAAAVDPRLARVRDHLRSLSNLMEEARLPQLRPEWDALRDRLQPAYEELANALRAAGAAARGGAARLPSLRPTNYTRNLFHVGMGLGCLLLVQHVLTPATMIAVAGAFTLMGWTFEISRRRFAWVNRALMFALGPVAHPHEAHRINSSTWYTTALFLMALVFDPLVCSVGIAVLAVGDPTAAVVGRRFGRTKLVNRRSLEGTLAFWVVGALAAAVTLAIYGAALSAGAIALAAAGAALAGALAELFSRRLDDNFTIPLCASLVAFLLL